MEDVYFLTYKVRVMNNYIPSAASVRTATDSKTQLDHSQFTDNKNKCVH